MAGRVGTFALVRIEVGDMSERSGLIIGLSVSTHAGTERSGVTA